VAGSGSTFIMNGVMVMQKASAGTGDDGESQRKE
jgi:hypothetical protein